jgi:transcriptional regulator with XRE-family HTH domain
MDHLLNSAFGTNLKNLRTGRHWSHDRLLLHDGLSRNHLINLENGSKEAGLFKIVYVAAVLDAPWDVLMAGLKERFLATTLMKRRQDRF